MAALRGMCPHTPVCIPVSSIVAGARGLLQDASPSEFVSSVAGACNASASQAHTAHEGHHPSGTCPAPFEQWRRPRTHTLCMHTQEQTASPGPKQHGLLMEKRHGARCSCIHTLACAAACWSPGVLWPLDPIRSCSTSFLSWSLSSVS